MRPGSIVAAIARPVRHAAALLLVWAAAGDAQTRLTILEEPGGTAVGVAVVLGAGPPWELESEAGLTHLAARAALETVRPELEALGGRTGVVCRQAATGVTLLFPPETWRAGTRLVLDALFRRPIPDDAVERARAALSASLAAQDAFTPEIETALGRSLFREDGRWARPACGRAETVADLAGDDVRRLQRARFRAARATAAVAGPVSVSAARGVLAAFLEDDGLPVLVPAPTAIEDGHTHVDSRTVTSWLALAFPFPAGTDIDALRLLGFHIRERFRPAPARHDVYDLRTDITRHGDGGWLSVWLIAAPDRVRRREAEIRVLVRELARRPLDDEDFDRLRRRYRGARLLELATPEARARAAAFALYFDSDVLPPTAAGEDLTPQRLRAAAAALAAPATASLGPR